jgi:hypothetical protein
VLIFLEYSSGLRSYLNYWFIIIYFKACIAIKIATEVKQQLPSAGASIQLQKLAASCSNADCRALVVDAELFFRWSPLDLDELRGKVRGPLTHFELMASVEQPILFSDKVLVAEDGCKQGGLLSKNLILHNRCFVILRRRKSLLDQIRHSAQPPLPDYMLTRHFPSFLKPVHRITNFVVVP